MNILVLNGPNINMLGIREKQIYGKDTYQHLVERCLECGKDLGIQIECYQSNHEGNLIDKIQSCYQNKDGIVINPGAYTHTSIALLDALKAVDIPCVEVHLSKVEEREKYRQISYVREACFMTITGKGIDGYIEAIHELSKTISK